MTIAFADAVRRTHDAIDARDIAALEAVLSELGNGMEPNALTTPELHSGERPLNVAASEGWTQGVTCLLSAGASADMASDANEDRGCLPLTFALRCDDPAAAIATCQVLIDAGADPERGHEHGARPSPLARVTQTEHVNTDVAEALLAMGCSVSSWPLFLHWQCSRDDITPAVLAEANAVAKGKIPAADSQRVTALHLLCANQRVSKALLMALDSGSTSAVKSKTGTLPVTLLCRNPNVTDEALDTVLAGLPRGISVKDCTNCAGIHDLCNNPALTAEMIRVALRHDPKCCTVCDPEGRTALHLVCLRPGGASLDVLSLLLKAHPEGTREVDKDQCTPLHHQLLGVESSLAPCTKLITMTPMDMVDSRGRNPFQCALAGVCGPAGTMSRKDCWALMENLARLYPPHADPGIVRELVCSPHLTRSLLSVLLQKIPGADELVKTPEGDGFLLLHTLLNRPPKATLGTREPMADGHLVDTALMLIDRFQNGTVMQAGPLKQTPFAMLVMTWRSSAPRDGDAGSTAESESRSSSSSGSSYSSAYSSYFAHHGLEEMATIYKSSSQGRQAAGGHEDLDISAIASKLVDQVASRYGEKCWNDPDETSKTPIAYCRENQLWSVEGILSKAGGPALDRSLKELVIASDVADNFPSPPPKTLRMAAWKEQVKQTQNVREAMPVVDRAEYEHTLNDIDSFEKRLRQGDPARGRAPTPAVDGKESGFEYDSEEDFDEPGFDMDVSTAAAEDFMSGRPRSRLEATLVSDPRGCTPAPGEPNVLALLCSNPSITTEALELVLNANISLASRKHGPEDDEEQAHWPLPLHCLMVNPSITGIEPAAVKRLVDACPSALTHSATLLVDMNSPAAESCTATPLHLLCFSPFCTAGHLTVLLDALIEYEASIGIAPEESHAFRSAQAVAGSKGTGTPFQILCSNPAGLPAVEHFLRRFPTAAKPPAPIWPAAEEADTEDPAEFSCEGSGISETPLHRAAANVSITEDLLIVLLEASPESTLLLDEEQCLPIHRLCANPGSGVTIWTITRMIEKTPPQCFKLVSKAFHWCAALLACLAFCCLGAHTVAASCSRRENFKDMLCHLPCLHFSVTIMHALVTRREHSDEDTAEAAQALLDICSSQQPAACWPSLYYRHVKSKKIKFYCEKTAVPRLDLSTHQTWPQTWNLHRGGALTLAEKNGLNMTASVLAKAGFVAGNDECRTADITELFPHGQQTKLFLDARGKAAAPPGSTPCRWEDDEWTALKTELLESPDGDIWRPWTKPEPVGPTPEELAAEAAAAEAAKAAEEAKAAEKAAAAAAQIEAEAAEATKGKKKKKKK